MKLKVGGRLRASVRRDGDVTTLSLEGFINEDCSFERILPALKYPLHIDLGGVERINSIGVRSWIGFIEATSKRGEVTLLRCPDVVVHQFSFVRSTLGAARVGSVLAPYVCMDCGATSSPEIAIDHDVDMAHPETALADRTCEDCGGVSRFDDVIETFFMFLQAQDSGQ